LLDQATAEIGVHRPCCARTAASRSLASRMPSRRAKRANSFVLKTCEPSSRMVLYPTLWDNSRRRGRRARQWTRGVDEALVERLDAGARREGISAPAIWRRRCAKSGSEAGRWRDRGRAGPIVAREQGCNTAGVSRAPTSATHATRKLKGWRDDDRRSGGGAGSTA
jgi:hypothetical protein